MQPTLEKVTKRALGRGLSALIPQAAQTDGGRGVARLPLDVILRDESQPRRIFDEQKLQELADSIRTQGVLQPILVRREGDRYRIIAGERRWRAAQRAGLDQIPALVREAGAGEAFELALVENLQRADLNPIEESEGYRRLMEEFGLTQEQVSERVGKERSSVANALRLLGLPDAVKEMVAAGSLNMGHARALLGLPEVPEMIEMAERISALKLSVREAERLVKQRRSPAPAAKKSAAASPSSESRALVEELQRLLGTKVRLVDQQGRGTLEIDFYTYDDLDRVLSLLRK